MDQYLFWAKLLVAARIKMVKQEQDCAVEII